MTPAIFFDHNRLLIDGVPRIVLCASLFPFRVPREQWAQRLDAVKRLGYHAVDVYIPWNFHEISPGDWDFIGQRDVEEFLRMAHEAGLYALVRPGPYICSEWDGGAIPAWVSTDRSLRIRQNDRAFLAAVANWYDQIIPIIARQQYGKGGAVITVQADNELDFFSCEDPQGYIGALVAMMRERGITVPIIACAGQGDLAGAGAEASGALPAVNLYPNDDDIDVDEQVRYYRRALDSRDVPMIVTETNRWHRTLRRLVGSGARFVGPYLQVSGWDFGYGTSVNNWGSLHACMTHDYDFGGVIDPSGQERADANDARRLAAIIGALGERLAAAELEGEPADVSVVEELGGVVGAHLVDAARSDSAVQTANAKLAVGSLALCGGGRMLTLTNVSADPLAVCVGSGDLPHVNLPARAGAMVVRELPMGCDLTLAATSGELIGWKNGDRSARSIDASGGAMVDSDSPSGSENEEVLTFSAPTMAAGSFWIALRAAADANRPGARSIRIVDIDGEITVRAQGSLTLLEGTQGAVCMEESEQGHRWRIVFTQPERIRERESAPETAVSGIEVASCEPRWLRRTPAATHRPEPLERLGVYSGTARYHARMGAASVKGIVLRGAADIVAMQCADTRTRWLANGGSDCFVPMEIGSCDVSNAEEGVSTCDRELTVYTRIWGHSNFDDSRLPALRLDSTRGIAGAIAVTTMHDCDSGWLVGYDERKPQLRERLRREGLVLGEQPRARGSLGSRSTTVWPHTLAYTRQLHVGDTAAALHIEGGQARCDVVLDGRPVGTLTPLQPTLWLGEIHEGEPLELIVHRTWGEEAGHAMLLTGHELYGWSVESYGIAQLREAASQASFNAGLLPLEIPAGCGVWLRIAGSALQKSRCLANTIARFDGEGVQITAFTHEYCLGRVLLGGLPGTTFAGGRGDVLVVPQTQGDLLLYIESTGEGRGALRGITLGGPVDRV